MSTKSFRMYLFMLCCVISILLSIAAYEAWDSRHISGPIAIATALVLLLSAQCFDLVRENAKLRVRREMSVLVPNFRGKQWYATVEIDHEGRLLAPADPRDRILSPADVSRDVNILRAPHYREGGNTITMLGQVYQVPSIPFGE